jgi:hypothetical protein
VSNGVIIFMNPPGYPFLERIASTSIGKWWIFWPFKELIRGNRIRRNPKDLEYMKYVLRSAYENAEIVQIGQCDDLRRIPLESQEEIVLLWPDGNGYGWNRVERYIFRHKNPQSKITVVNGRRRIYIFNKSRRFVFLILRFLEKFFVIEFVFMLFFILITPFLLLFDLLRGGK